MSYKTIGTVINIIYYINIYSFNFKFNDISG